MTTETMFRLRGQVEEQVIVTIPVQGDIVTTEAAAKTKAPAKIQLDDIAIKHTK